jgi:putative oxidoreductase
VLLPLPEKTAIGKSVFRDIFSPVVALSLLQSEYLWRDWASIETEILQEMKNLLLLKFLPVKADLALLVLRITAILSLFIKHGIEKGFTFSAMVPHFVDPIGIGLGPSLLIAMIGDFVCSFLMIIGLATRWAALFSFTNILVAWILVHHFAYFGKTSTAGHGELIVVYLSVTLSLFISGAGKYSVDQWILNRSVADVA